MFITGYAKYKIMRTSPFILVLAFSCILFSGCFDVEKDPVIGIWEWSDGKGYTERYTFHENMSFQAEALGSVFFGKWEEISPGHYQVTYWDRNDADMTRIFTERVIYDEESDQMYFPGHQRVI